MSTGGTAAGATSLTRHSASDRSIVPARPCFRASGLSRFAAKHEVGDPPEKEPDGLPFGFAQWFQGLLNGPAAPFQGALDLVEP